MADGDEVAGELMEGGPVSMSAFIQLRDTDGGDIIVNVREITAVMSVVGRAKAALPAGSNARLMLRGGVNIPLTATIEEIGALLSTVAIFAGPFEESAEPGGPTWASPKLYTPGKDD